MAENTLRPASNRASDFDTVEELGIYIGQITALLRAVVGCPGREDEGWLVGLAHDVAESARARYVEWAKSPEAKR